MKKIKLIMLAVFSIYAFAGFNSSYGFSIVKPDPSALWKYMKASEFVKLSPKEFTAITGQKLNFFQRMQFNLTKMRMKHDLKKNPDLKITDYMKAGGSSSFQMDILWLILGFLIIGVILAYVTHQESYKITSAWIGLGLLLLGSILFWHSIF